MRLLYSLFVLSLLWRPRIGSAAAESPEPGEEAKAAAAEAKLLEALPEQVQEMARLAKAGLGRGVITSFLENAPPFERVTADQLIYLRDLGLDSAILKAIIEHPEDGAAATAEVSPAEFSSAAAMDSNLPAPRVIYYPTELSDQSFYPLLAPYGVWLEVPGQGLCWQPAVCSLNRNWRPYCDNGDWVWSSRGWCWNSGYSWGWAPFHFGRWFRHGDRGWLWRPGTEWAPAWVTWRRDSQYTGWAPLPPGAGYRRGRWSDHGHPVAGDFDFGLPAEDYNFVANDNFPRSDWWNVRLSQQAARRVIDTAPVVNGLETGEDGQLRNTGILDGTARELTTAPVAGRREPEARQLLATLAHGMQERQRAERGAAEWRQGPGDFPRDWGDRSRGMPRPEWGWDDLQPGGDWSEPYGGFAGWSGGSWYGGSGPIPSRPRSSALADLRAQSPWVAGDNPALNQLRSSSPFVADGNQAMNARRAQSPWVASLPQRMPESSSGERPPNSGGNYPHYHRGRSHKLPIGRGEVGGGMLGGEFPAASAPWSVPGESRMAQIAPYGVYGVPPYENDGGHPDLPFGQTPRDPGEPYGVFGSEPRRGGDAYGPYQRLFGGWRSPHNNYRPPGWQPPFNPGSAPNLGRQPVLPGAPTLPGAASVFSPPAFAGPRAHGGGFGHRGGASVGGGGGGRGREASAPGAPGAPSAH